MNNILNFMEYYYTVAKTVVVSLVAAITAYFLPIEHFFRIISLLFAIDFIIGWHAGAKVNKESFDMGKAFKSVKYILIYISLIAVCFYIGSEMPSKDSNVIEFVSWITWAIILFYGINILKNLKRLMPDNQLIALLYDVVNLNFKKLINKYTNTNNDEK